MDRKFVIKKSDIENNINVLKSKVHNARIYAVLKGNAYGMGLCKFAGVLCENGINSFAVTLVSDALLLKESFPQCSVLLLTPCSTEDEIEKLICSDVVLSVDHFETAQKISDIAKNKDKTAVIHIKLDTGMGRYGFLPNEADLIEEACRLENINAEGIFTHLHSAFNKKIKPSEKQFEIFTNVISKLENKGITFEMKHICNSIAIFRFPKMHLTAVRAGSALIGRVSPICGRTSLCKVGTLYSKISDIRTLPKGHNIGYASLYKTKKETKIATVNLGYSDGVAVTKANDTFRFIDILRYMYNNFKLIFSPTPLICKINGKNAPSLGRIGMTNLVIKIDDIDNVKIGDYVEVPSNPIYLSDRIERIYES